MKFTSRSGRQLADLKAHYVNNLRLNALESLDKALVTAAAAIELAPAKGLPAPRPYPQLARPGILWRHQGRYWIAWRRVPNLAITAVFYDAADIPGRL